MSQQGGVSPNAVSGTVIDSLEFARTGGHFEGGIAVAEMSRLAGSTGDASAILRCSVAGEQDSEGQSFLVVQVVGELQLSCQRCLKTLQWPVRVSSRLLLVAPGAAWPDDDLAVDDCDAIAADKAQSLPALVEDEVMLALPLSPRHELCDQPAAAGEGGEPSPFAALAKLKKS
jgi:uncharacterized protein